MGSKPSTVKKILAEISLNVDLVIGEDPKLDVLWVLTNNHVKPPFGQVIRYNDLQEA